MARYWPKVRLRVGDIVSFDGEVFKIVEKTEADRYYVEGNSTYQKEEKHIDWFSEKAAEASVVTIIKD